MQLELFEREQIGQADLEWMLMEIRQAYWHLRNLRKVSWNNARRRREYRKVAVHKKRLQLAGVERVSAFSYPPSVAESIGRESDFFEEEKSDGEGTRA